MIRIPQKILQTFTKSYRSHQSSSPMLYKTIGEQLKDISEVYPDNLAVVSSLQNIECPYSELFLRSRQIAAAFVSMGLEKGDRIGIFSPNNFEWTLTQFASAMAGLILVNINPAYQSTELEYTLNKVGCKAVIMKSYFKHSNYVKMFKELAPELEIAGELHARKVPFLRSLILIDDDVQRDGYFRFRDLYEMYSRQNLEEVDLRMSKQDPDSITNIQFTSGTTGKAKAACLSHFNILNNGKFVGERLQYTNYDKVCISPPLFHCFGMVIGNLACLVNGATMVYPSDGFNAIASLQAVTKYKCTSLYGVPNMFVEYLDEYKKNTERYDISSLRTGLIGATIVHESLMKQIINVLGIKDIAIGYGQTETSPITCLTKITDPLEVRVNTSGSALNIEVKIIDQDTGLVVPIGTPGEFCTRGYAVMKKYWDDEEATKATIDESGFLHSGDIAIMNPNGTITVVGRIKDMIIRGGEKIYPKEIEDYLSLLPGVEFVQVVGCKDEKYGEEIVALIKMKADAQKLTGLDVYEHCHKKIAHFKIPKYVKFVDDFPCTITGKPQKFKMRNDIDKELQIPEKVELYKIR